MLWLTVAMTDSLCDTHAAGGSVTVSVRDEADESPVITRMVVQRADAPGRRVTVRRSVPAGVGAEPRGMAVRAAWHDAGASGRLTFRERASERDATRASTTESA